MAWLDRIPRPEQPAGRAIINQLIETGQFEVTEYRFSPFGGERWEFSFDFSPPYRYNPKAYVGFTYEEPTGSLKLSFDSEPGTHELVFSKIDLLKKALGVDRAHLERESKAFREATLQLEHVEDRLKAFRKHLS